MNSYGGLIIQRITYSDDPQYFVGQVFHGYFQYQSDDPNGVFNIVSPIFFDGNRSLQGILYLPLTEEPGCINSLCSTMNDGSLTVSAGAVTSFSWSFTHGGTYASFENHQFNIRTMIQDPSSGAPSQHLSTVQGELHFTPSYFISSPPPVPPVAVH